MSMFAVFAACMLNTQTGNVECSASYTEMDSVLKKGESCEYQAKKLQAGSLNSIRLTYPEMVVYSRDSYCTKSKQSAKQGALVYYNQFKEAGDTAVMFEF